MVNCKKNNAKTLKRFINAILEDEKNLLNSKEIIISKQSREMKRHYTAQCHGYKYVTRSVGEE